jgi:Tol biopolymer transport system component
MTSREDLLDQYIDALNNGSLDSFDLPDDPELQSLLQTVDQVKSGAAIEWPQFDFPTEMSRDLEQQLSRPESGAVPDEEPVGDASTAPVIGQLGGNSGPQDDDRRDWRWYSRQFAGMTAAALIVISFGIGLAFVLGDWGDEIQSPGTFVEEGQIPGTILYAEYENGEQTLARIDADGSNPLDLATRPALRGDTPGFEWSPDGQWIAWFNPEAEEQWSPAGIMLTSADGSETESLDMPPVEGAMRLDVNLGWTHDGSSLAFVHQDPDTEQTRIGIVHRQTGELQSIEPIAEDEGFNDSSPAWGPHDWVLAFSRTDESGQRGIYLLYAGMNEPVRLVDPDPRATQPEWSPDGESIAYIAGGEDPSRGNLHIVDVDSGRSENISNHDRTDYLPAWSSQDQIAFMSDHADRHHDIFLVNPDGTELRNLTEDYNWQAIRPEWSDDGRYLTFTSQNEDENRWRINVYDVDEDRLYTVLESENQLYHAQWQPEEQSDPEPDVPDEADVSVNAPSDDMLELIRQSAEMYISDETGVALTVNNQEITAAQIESSQAISELNRTTMQELVDEQAGQHPEMTAYNEAFIELIDEYGPENVGLGMVLTSAAVRDYAEENDLTATDEQIDEAIERQRESHEMIEQQDPEAAAAVGTALIDVIGEDRYWEEYLPRVLESSITERNVDDAAWQQESIDDDDPASLQEQDHYLAEFRADLINDATIEVEDESALGDADLDRAVEYITQAYPELQRMQLELREGTGQTTGQMNPIVPEDGFQTEGQVERYLYDLFELQGFPDATVLEITETSRDEAGIDSWSVQMIGDPDGAVWEVETTGYIPEPMVEEPGPDGGGVPAAEQVEATLWIDPELGMLPVFDARDTSRSEEDER